MSKEEMFNWLASNRIGIVYTAPMKWTRSDGSQFYSDFILSSADCQYGPYETLEQAIEDICK